MSWQNSRKDILVAIRNLEVMYEEIKKDIFKCNKHTMEYVLKECDDLRAVSEFLLNEDEDYNDEVNSKLCYERVVYKYLKSEDSIKGISYYDSGNFYFDEGSLEYDDVFYIFDIKYRSFESGLYNKPFEIEMNEYDKIIEKVW